MKIYSKNDYIKLMSKTKKRSTKKPQEAEKIINKTIKKVNKKKSTKSAEVENTLDLIDFTTHLNDLYDEEEIHFINNSNSKKIKDVMIKEFLEENSLTLMRIDERQIERPKPTKEGQSIVLLLSDWHVGKVIVNERNKIVYNSEIAKQRIETELVTQLMDKINCVDKTKKIDEIVLVMAGDMVDNDIIYDTQRFGIDTGVALQFNNVVESLIQMLYNLEIECKKIFKKYIPINIYGISGNHGRASSKSDIGSSSWDTAVYAALKIAANESSLLRKYVRVDFSIADQMMIDVRGFKGLVTHGGPPQAETAAARRTFGGLYEIYNYDFAMYGHRHHWGIATFNGRPLFMNGSLCGYDDYARKLAVRDKWSQLMFTVTDSIVGRQIMRLEEE